MGYSPTQCAVVEDSLDGIKAAQAAGMLPVLYDPENIHTEISGTCKIRHMRELKSEIT